MHGTIPGLHFVECDLIQRGRRIPYFAERDPDRMGLSNTVDDILSGQFSDVRKVYRANIEERRFDDVTEEVAQAVLDRLDAQPSRAILEFLEEHLGCAVMARVCRELEPA